MDARSERSSILTRYFSEIRQYPLLSREEERELAEKVQAGDREALDEMVESNLSFVVKVASEYRNLGLPFEDLLNEGNIGLIEAAHRFDPEKGTKFITYAIWWIRKSILKALSEHSNLVRVPNYQMKKVREVQDTEKALRRELGRKPQREEISRKLDQSIKKIDEVLQFSVKEISLDDKIGKDKDTPISDYLVDGKKTSQEDDLISRESSVLVKQALGVLTEQERLVVRHRFGLGGGKILTLKEIGEIMGISRERVRQIEAQAKGRLRRAFNRPISASAPPKRIYPNRALKSRTNL